MGVELTRINWLLREHEVKIEVNFSHVLWAEDHQEGTALYFSTREYIVVKESRREILDRLKRKD